MSDRPSNVLRILSYNIHHGEGMDGRRHLRLLGLRRALVDVGPPAEGH